MAEMIWKMPGESTLPSTLSRTSNKAGRAALDYTLVRGLRALSSSERNLMSQLRELDDTKAHFRIQPITPAFPDEYRFDVESLDQRTVTVNLHSTRERIGIPVSRVAEILNLGRGQTP